MQNTVRDASGRSRTVLDQKELQIEIFRCKSTVLDTVIWSGTVRDQKLLQNGVLNCYTAFRDIPGRHGPYGTVFGWDRQGRSGTIRGHMIIDIIMP